MPKKNDFYVCDCGHQFRVQQVRNQVSNLLRKSVETSQFDGDCGEESSRAALVSYESVLQEMSSLVHHPWKGLVIPEQLYWKSLRIVNGNKIII